MIGPMFVPNYRPLAKAVDNPQYEVITAISGTEIVTNGNFDSGVSGWSFGTGWSHNASPTQARLAFSSSGATLTQVASFDTSKMHRLQFTTITVTGSQWFLKAEISGSTFHVNGSMPHQGARTYYFDFKPTVAFSITNIRFSGWSGSATVVALDSISIREATATKMVEVAQWYAGGNLPAKGSFDAPTDAMTDWWIGE